MDEVAQYTYTSKATLVRFAKALGYKGWKDFIKAFIEKLKYQELNDTEIDVKSLTSNDCAIIISYSGNNFQNEPICYIETFQRQGVSLIGVTSEGNNYIREKIDCVLTMVGTGSEMNGGSVITNDELKIKSGRVYGVDVYPNFSILNPEYTFILPEYQMVSGVFDIMSHLMEQYFSGNDNNTTGYVIEALLRSVIDNSRVAIKNLTDYEARSNMMWSATLALNTVAGLSKEQDWEVHMIEHQLGPYTD